MFSRTVGQPTQLKKVVYIFAWVVLGLLLSLLLHAYIEVKYIHWLLSHGKEVQFYGNCTLSPALQIAILLLGVVGGFFLGRFFWKKIYVDRAWAKKKI